jgi:hypothetical protein
LHRASTDNRQVDRHYELRRRNCELHNSQIGCFVQGARLEEAFDAASTCCSRGEGHPVLLPTVTYPDGRTHQFSVRRERVAEVRRWLTSYRELKEAIEAVCELNYDLLRRIKEAGSAA